MAQRNYLSGTVEERYRVYERLGVGAFGEVYRGEDLRLSRHVALKRLRLEIIPEVDEVDRARQRFVQEAQVAAGLRHPNMVTVYDIVHTDDYLIMVLELIEGPTLETLLAKRGRFEFGEAVQLITPVAMALDHSHAEGVIHRDIKPANVMVEPDGTVKVTDFGIAKIDTGATLTRTGYLLGTPNYMSPEQARGEELDGRADLFSLACILYECLVGVKAFDGEHVTAVLLKIVGSDLPSLDVESVGLPAELGPFFEKALAKDREERFDSGEEMAMALRDMAVRAGVLTGVSAEWRPTPLSELVPASELAALTTGPPTGGETSAEEAALTSETVLAPSGDFEETRIQPSSELPIPLAPDAKSPPPEASPGKDTSLRPLLFGAGAVVVALTIGAAMMVLRPDPETVQVAVSDGGPALPAEILAFPAEAPDFEEEATTGGAPPPPAQVQARRPEPRPVPKKEAPVPEAAPATKVAQQPAPEEVVAEPAFQPPPDAAFVETFMASSGVEFRVRPKRAIVEVDGSAIGIADDYDSAARAYHFNGPGSYAVRLSAREYVPMWVRVVIDESAPESVARIRLRLQKGDDSGD